jgi:hypothetical protein
MYMNAPNGMNIGNYKCSGLVQSAREVYKNLICEHKDLGFSENKSDPCLMSKRNATDIKNHWNLC